MTNDELFILVKSLQERMSQLELTVNAMDLLLQRIIERVGKN